MLEMIFKRRSVRQFTSGPVTEDQIKTLLQAAMAAPSAGNEQPWHFVVLKDAELKSKLVNICQYWVPLRNAPLGIVVCADLSLEKYNGFWVQDAAAATQNILLAAVELQLGAVWMGVYPEKERVDGLKSALGLPASVIPLSLVAIGHPKSTPNEADRYLPERIHYEHW